jgi:hypothetical protein
MSTNTLNLKSNTNTDGLVRFIVILNGVMGVLPGIALLFTPALFYNVADFAPYNQHFMGDAGAFTFTIGAILLLASRNPLQYRSVIGLAAVGNLLHVANHLYNDALIEGWATPHIFTNTLPLAILALALLWTYFRLGQTKAT